MEGLLPMVYRAIKKNKTRRQYEYLSSEAALNHNVAEVYPESQSQVFWTPPSQKVAGFHAEKKGHRPCKSVQDLDYGFSSPQPRKASAASSTSKQVVRFRNHKMFSCITGV